MKLKEFLLNGFSFNEILRQFAIDQSDFTIQDEDLILSRNTHSSKEILKERVHIQGRNTNGIVNFFGTLHCNLLDKLAVFELDSVEQQQQQQISAA